MKSCLIALLMVIVGLAASGQAETDLVQPAVQDSAILSLHNFTVTEKDKKAVLRWRSDSLSAPESFYAVERSNNGVEFSLVGITKGTGSRWIEFSDESPPKGKIFYRIKLSAGQTTFYSETVSATLFSDVLCKFYPNPVDKVLIVRSEFNIELLISDRFGKPLITGKFPAGLKVIDVSALEPGIYIITLFQKETGRQLTDKLVKK